MMDIADVVVVGAGVIGASVAYHLAERGAGRVLLVERGERQGMGSTGKATGGIRAQFSTEVNVQMSLYSIDVLSRFKELTGVDAGYAPRGYLFLATSEDVLEQLKELRERQRGFGLTDVEILDRHQVHALAPVIDTSDVLGASFRQADGFIDPVAVMNGFTRAGLDCGVELVSGIEVTGFEISAGKISAVRTSQGAITAGTVVIAAGAWSGAVASIAGLEVPVEPLRRQVLAVRTDEEVTPGMPMVIDTSTSFHFRPSPPDSRNEFFLVWPDPAERSSFETKLTDTFKQTVLDFARNRAPIFERSTVDYSRSRAGLYEMTPDHQPIISGCSEVEGLYLVTGFSGHGVMHSPAAGRMAAELILDGQSHTIDCSSFSLERFKLGITAPELSLI